jgi:hypothetical protein
MNMSGEYERELTVPTGDLSTPVELLLIAQRLGSLFFRLGPTKNYRGRILCNSHWRYRHSLKKGKKQSTHKIQGKELKKEKKKTYKSYR